MPSARTRTGNLGESIAAGHLEAMGWTLLTRNYRTRFGEVDLIARDGDELVFVEVRTKRSLKFGTAEESVTVRKRQHLVLAAMQYLQEQKLKYVHWRLDLLAITLQDGPATINHLRALEVPEV